MTDKNHTPQQHLLTLSSNIKNPKCKKLIITPTQTIIFEIWQSRNNLKYDKIQLANQTIIHKINSHLQTILNAHYRKHKVNDTLNIF